MNNPEYFRLIDKNGNFVGFKRIVTEYLPAAAARWQLSSFPHDERANQKLSAPAMGIATLGREKITKDTQTRVTHPKSKSHDEPTSECPFTPETQRGINDLHEQGKRLTKAVKHGQEIK